MSYSPSDKGNQELGIRNQAGNSDSGLLTPDSSENYPQEYKDGYVEFFYQKFIVNEHVLIPRFETEELVRRGIEVCKVDKVDTLVDIGTGSGIIPISIASNVEIPNVIGTDISYEALEVAAENTRRTLQIEPGLNIKENFGSCIDGGSFFLLQGDLLEPLKQIDFSKSRSILITANLPYVGEWEKDAMSEDTQFEPDVALFGDSKEGFDIYRRFFQQLSEFEFGTGSEASEPVQKFTCLIEFGMWQRDLAEEELSKYDWEFLFFADQRGIERFAQIDLSGC